MAEANVRDELEIVLSKRLAYCPFNTMETVRGLISDALEDYDDRVRRGSSETTAALDAMHLFAREEFRMVGY